MTTALRISNRQARWLWLEAQGLSATPTGPLDVMGMIHALGFVQLDTIQVVARAHHHILWSRNQNYRERMLNPLLAKERAIFEHYTHDASVIPMEFLPMWQRQFRRKREALENSKWYEGMSGPGHREAIKDRIAREGALSTRDFESDAPRSKEMWARPPHKKALDYMWYVGELATCFRRDFVKYYNLADRVFPAALQAEEHSDEAQLDWLCRAALDRMGFGTPGEIHRFWEAATAREVKTWSETADLIPVEIEGADKTLTKGAAPQDIEARLAALSNPTTRLRILNPFDPVSRDRNRLSRLFGFDYRIEMFVPAAKRQWGYYVYPLLEGDRFVGRLEVKATRAEGRLTVSNLWVEPCVRWSNKRQEKLEAELQRMARFVDCPEVIWQVKAPA